MTGGTGLIGRRIVKLLRERGHRVRVLSRESRDGDDATEYFKGSVTDEKAVSEFVRGADNVFHAAGEVRVPARMRAVNVEGTRNLLLALKPSPPKYLCFISSAGVVGRARGPWITEETPCNPRNDYEKSKWEAEQLVMAAAPHLPNVVSLRPINVMAPERPGSAGLALRNRIRENFSVFFKGGEPAHLVHVDNVAAASVYFLDKEWSAPQVYFVGQDEDSRNTHAGVWASMMAILDGRPLSGVTPTPHLPIIVPFVVRKLRRGFSNYGDTRYSSAKLRATGFVYPVDFDAMLRSAAALKSEGL